jgi:hypothetical protein
MRVQVLRFLCRKQEGFKSSVCPRYKTFRELKTCVGRNVLNKWLLQNSDFLQEDVCSRLDLLLQGFARMKLEYFLSYLGTGTRHSYQYVSRLKQEQAFALWLSKA